MAERCDESGVIADQRSEVLDRGYVAYKSLYHIDLQSSTWVSWMKPNGAFRRIKNNPHEKDGPLSSAVLIPLSGSNPKKFYPKPLRKVR